MADLASPNTRNASPSNNSVPAHKNCPDFDTSKLKNGFNCPDSAVSSKENYEISLQTAQNKPKATKPKQTNKQTIEKCTFESQSTFTRFPDIPKSNSTICG